VGVAVVGCRVDALVAAAVKEGVVFTLPASAAAARADARKEVLVVVVDVVAIDLLPTLGTLPPLASSIPLLNEFPHAREARAALGDGSRTSPLKR